MNWTKLIDPSRRPIYLAVADAIAQAIDQGHLQPGERLAPHRILARQLGVDLTTVTRCYAEARRRGLVDATVGRGTFVRGSTKSSAAADQTFMQMDMSMNVPPQSQSPGLSITLRDSIISLLNSPGAHMLMGYPSGTARPRDLDAASFWLSPILGRADPERLLLSAGAQCALTAIITLLVVPGATILTEFLTYPNLRALAAHFGIRLVAVKSDRHGMLPDSVEAACRELHPQAIYCVPTIQNPTTSTMPVERRQELARVARQFGVPVIEDDAYGMLPTQPMPAIATFAPNSVYYIGTLSKCLSPGLRLAYVAAPGAAEAQRLTVALRATSLIPSSLLAALMTSWIEDGKAAALRDGIRRENAARQKIAAEILPGGCVRAHPEGTHLWLTLPDHWNRLEFVAYVRQLGVALIPSEAFVVGSDSAESKPPNAIRICLGAAPGQEALRGALHAVADTLRLQGTPHLMQVV